MHRRGKHAGLCRMSRDKQLGHCIIPGSHTKKGQILDSEEGKKGAVVLDSQATPEGCNDGTFRFVHHRLQILGNRLYRCW